MVKFDDGMTPDLDFPAKRKYEKAKAARAPRAPRPRVPRRETGRRMSAAAASLGLLAAAVLVPWTAWTLGRTSGLEYADGVIAEISAEASATENLYRQALDANEHLINEAIDASRTIDALTSEVESATAAVESLRIEVEDLELLNRALKNEIQKNTAPSTTTPQSSPQETGAGAWSREKVASTLTAAAQQYGLTDTETAWIVETGCRVAYRESTYRPDARNGQYLGLFQFGSAWGTASQRLDPVWSCYRFVRVYAEGGEAKILQHWRATV